MFSLKTCWFWTDQRLASVLQELWIRAGEKWKWLNLSCHAGIVYCPSMHVKGKLQWHVHPLTHWGQLWLHCRAQGHFNSHSGHPVFSQQPHTDCIRPLWCLKFFLFFVTEPDVWALHSFCSRSEPCRPFEIDTFESNRNLCDCVWSHKGRKKSPPPRWWAAIPLDAAQGDVMKMTEDERSLTPLFFASDYFDPELSIRWIGPHNAERQRICTLPLCISERTL